MVIVIVMVIKLQIIKVVVVSSKTMVRYLDPLGYWHVWTLQRACRARGGSSRHAPEYKSNALAGTICYRSHRAKTPYKRIIQGIYRSLVKGLLGCIKGLDHGSYELGCLFGLGECNVFLRMIWLLPIIYSMAHMLSLHSFLTFGCLRYYLARTFAHIEPPSKQKGQKYQ